MSRVLDPSAVLLSLDLPVEVTRHALKLSYHMLKFGYFPRLLIYFKRFSLTAASRDFMVRHPILKRTIFLARQGKSHASGLPRAPYRACPASAQRQLREGLVREPIQGPWIFAPNLTYIH
jgi:hypothetical protein